MNKYKKRWLLSIILVVVVLVITFSIKIFYDSREVREAEKHQEIQESMFQDNSVGIGMLNKNKEIVDSGEKIKVTGNLVSQTLTLDHNFDFDREYLLMVFVDYKQHPFKINDTSQMMDSYSFKMNKYSNSKIQIDSQIAEKNQEIMYLVIPNPNHKLKEFNISDADTLSKMYAVRHRLIGSNKGLEQYETPVKTIKDDNLDAMFLTDSPDTLNIMHHAKNGTGLFYSVGNDSESKKKYIILAIDSQGKQLPLGIKGNPVTVEVEPNSRNIYAFQLQSEIHHNFQLVAVPNPYMDNLIEAEDIDVYASFRILVDE